jgi:hypothetical protein
MLPVYRADANPVAVKKDPTKTNGWIPAEGPDWVVLKAQRLPGLVVMNDCAIDKSINEAVEHHLSEVEITKRSSKTDVLVCPVRPIPESWPDRHLRDVANGRVYHQFLLPPYAPANWSGGYADLRWVVTFRLNDLLTSTRLLALTGTGVETLQSALTYFFSWRDTNPEATPAPLSRDPKLWPPVL